MTDDATEPSPRLQPSINLHASVTALIPAALVSMYYPEEMKAQVNHVQSIEPHETLPPNWDLNPRPLGLPFIAITTILPLHRYYKTTSIVVHLYRIRSRVFSERHGRQRHERRPRQDHLRHELHRQPDPRHVMDNVILGSSDERHESDEPTLHRVLHQHAGLPNHIPDVLIENLLQRTVRPPVPLHRTSHKRPNLRIHLDVQTTNCPL